MPQEVRYAGKTYPQDAAPARTYTLDQTNNPGLVVIGGTAGDVSANISLQVIAGGGSVPSATSGVILPADTVILVKWVKRLARSEILNGPDVTQMIRTRASEVIFTFTLRQPDTVNGGYKFPQDDFDTVLKNIFLPNKVQSVQNTWLNKQGITQLVFEELEPTVHRGATKMPVRLKGYQNMPGTSSLILTS